MLHRRFGGKKGAKISLKLEFSKGKKEGEKPPLTVLLIDLWHSQCEALRQYRDLHNYFCAALQPLKFFFKESSNNRSCS